MGKIPGALRQAIAANIRACRAKKFPGRGGGKKCAEAFGVSPQQWSPWERGMRTPDEVRLSQLAEFFGVTVEELRRDHSRPGALPCENPEFRPVPGAPPAGGGTERQADAAPHTRSAGVSYCPFYRPPKPGQPLDDSIGGLCWLAERFFGELRGFGVTFLHPGDIDLIFERFCRLQPPPR